jgi:hypothetical protein
MINVKRATAQGHKAIDDLDSLKSVTGCPVDASPEGLSEIHELRNGRLRSGEE